MRSTIIALLGLCLSLSPRAGSAAGEGAVDGVLARAGVKAGLCCLPQGAAPELALGLAGAGFEVYVREPRADRAAALRQAAAAAGVLGRSLHVEEGGGNPIPLAGQYADLVLVAEATDASLAALSAADVARVLSPVNGVAAIGSATGAGLTREALTRWAGNAFAKQEIAADGKGLWLMARTARPAGYDDWTHWYHDPGQNPVSADTAFAVPTRIGWLAKPINVQRTEGCRIAANGRVFVAMGAAEWPDGPGTPLAFELTARSAYNGLILWRRPLPKGTRVIRSLMVADGDEVLMLASNAVLRLDGATGAETGRIALPADGGVPKWLGLADGLRVILTGPPDPPDLGKFGDLKIKSRILVHGELGYGTQLAALDAAGAVKWSHRVPAAIDGRSLAIAAGRVYYHAPGARVACLDLKTGAELWAQSGADVIGAARGSTNTLDITVNLEERPSAFATAQAYYLLPPEGSAFVALSAADGSLLWQMARRGGRAMSALVAGDRLYGTALQSDNVLEALTGKPLGQRFNAGGCGVFTATPTLLCGQVNGAAFDLVNGKNVPGQPLKTQCHLGMMIADGRLFSVPAACRCGVVWGFACLTPAGDETLPDPRDAARLERGPARPPAAVGAGQVVAGDWPTHRGSTQRSAVSPAKAPAQLKVLWSAPASALFAIHPREPNADTVEHAPTAAVSAGDLVVLAGSDGAVRALGAADGKPRWTAWCEGPVLAPPTIAAGRVYAGSADGRLYCFQANDGALLWRFRAAPAERRVMFYGYLQSPWPVNSGVLVQDGVAYAAAGTVLERGATVYALNAATGEIKWAYRPGAGDPDLVPWGGMAMVGGRLWLRTFFGGSGGAIFDPASGTRGKPQVTGGTRGAAVAQCGPGLAVYGGADAFRLNREAGRSETVGLLPLDAEGLPRLPDYTVSEASLTTPAGDGADLVVGIVGRPNTLECWDTAGTVAWITNRSASVDLAKLPGWRLGQLPEEIPGNVRANPPMRKWGPVEGVAYAVALTADAVVTVFAPAKSKGQPRLMVLERATGAVRCELELPSLPLNDGLSVTRDGVLLVVLRDGTVLACGG